MDSLLLDILPQNRYIFNEIYLFVYFFNYRDASLGSVCFNNAPHPIVLALPSYTHGNFIIR